jgi:hypothetical protein
MLGSRGISLALALVGLFAGAQVQAADLSLQIRGPSVAKLGKPVKLSFTAVAAGHGNGFYFLEPFWWGSDGLRIVARGEDGSEYESTSVFWDIEGKYFCTFFKPLSRGNRFSFEAWIVMGPVPVLDPSQRASSAVIESASLPHLVVPAGKYKVRWIYEPKIGDNERKCAVADVPIWVGHTESPAVDLVVR